MERKMNEEEQIGQAIFANQLTFRGCPFCELFGTEIGILNAPDRDYRLFSIHLRKDHFREADEVSTEFVGE
jgi:hypothetical protein